MITIENDSTCLIFDQTGRIVDQGPYRVAGEARAAACRVEGPDEPCKTWRQDGAESPGRLPAQFVLEGGVLAVLLVGPLEEH